MPDLCRWPACATKTVVQPQPLPKAGGGATRRLCPGLWRRRDRKPDGLLRELLPIQTHGEAHPAADVETSLPNDDLARGIAQAFGHTIN